jgi:hypothetical protein
VRLVASAASVVQIAQTGWLDYPFTPDGEHVAASKQITLLRTLFEPLTYDDGGPDGSTGEAIAARLIELREQQLTGRSGHPVRRAAVEALSRIEPVLPDPAHILERQADTLNHMGRTRTNVPQALFYEAPRIKAGEEEAALERRLAAWFYLEHRVGAGKLPDDDPRRKQWLELGQNVVGQLYGGADRDVELAEWIEERLL